MTGADSRTVVNIAMRGKTSLVGLVAEDAILLVLLYQTDPLTGLPTAALAALILVCAIDLFDLADMRLLYRLNYRECLSKGKNCMPVA